MSYFALSENTFVNMSRLQYKIALIVATSSNLICPIQFVGKFYKTDFTRMIVAYENVHMTSEDLPGEDKSFGNCSWLAGSVVRKYTAKYVYNKTIDIKNLVVEKISTRPIPLNLIMQLKVIAILHYWVRLAQERLY